jgi:hypothetical protein
MNTNLLFIFAAMTSATYLKGAEIKEQAVKPEELASAMGIRPYCADLVLDGKSYPRLVAEVKNQEGKISEIAVVPGGGPHELYRIRAFLFEDVKSRVPHRLIFNLSSDDDVAGSAFIDFPEGSRAARQTRRSKPGEWFYEVWIFGPDSAEDFFRVRLRIETSAKPYPVPSSIADRVDFQKAPAEQDGTGQPATRPESKSEGGDKPQPEAEGRSR